MGSVGVKSMMGVMGSRGEVWIILGWICGIIGVRY